MNTFQIVEAYATGKLTETEAIDRLRALLDGPDGERVLGQLAMIEALAQLLIDQWTIAESTDA